MENAEINNIIKILGLQYKKNYSDPESLKTLRYGRLMIMTDQVRSQPHSTWLGFPTGSWVIPEQGAGWQGMHSRVTWLKEVCTCKSSCNVMLAVKGKCFGVDL